MEYLKPLIDAFTEGADLEKAQQMENYMRNRFPFLGLQSKQRRELQSIFFKKYGYPERDKLFNVVKAIWGLSEREYQYTAVDLLNKFTKKFQVNDIISIEELIASKSWWDTVDGLASWICGGYFISFPDKIGVVTEKWMNSGNFWLQRCCLLYQLKYKEKTNTQLLESFIKRLHNEEEFFIRKAIGWILREYSKTDPHWVRKFVRETPLSGLSYKEATKYINV